MSLETLKKWLETANTTCTFTEDDDDGMFSVYLDDEEIGMIQLNEDGSFQSYETYDDREVCERLSNEELFKRGKMILHDVFEERAKHFPRATGVELGMYTVSLHPVDETGKELPIYALSVTMYLDGMVESITSPEGTFRVEDIELLFTKEELKENYIASLPLSLRFMKYDAEEYIGGDDTYHLVYDVISESPLVHPNGELEFFEEEEEENDVDPEWADLTKDFIEKHIAPVDIRVVSTVDSDDVGPNSVEVTFIRMYKGIRVGDRSTLHFSKEFKRVIHAELDVSLYAEIEESASPVMTKEEVRKALYKELDFHIAPSYKDEEYEDDFIHVFERGYVERFPDGKGAVHAYDAVTKQAWYVNTSSIIEE